MDDLSKIEVCLKDGQALEPEIEKVIDDFEKGDITDIIAGIEEVGVILQQLPQYLGDCEGMQTDIARIEKWAQIFTSPAALLAALEKNIPQNVSTIEQDVMKAKNDLAT